MKWLNRGFRGCKQWFLLIVVVFMVACTSYPKLETVIEVPTPDSRFSDPKVISPATAADVVQLTRYGAGYLEGAYAWAQKVPRLAIVTKAGISIYDATARREVRFIETPGTMASVALSPDGQILAAGGEDNSLVLMDVTTGDLLYTLQAHSQDQQITLASPHVRELAFTPDGRRLATVDPVDQEVIKLWDVETGRLLTAYRMLGGVDRIGFVNEQLLAVQGQGSAVNLWNTVTEQAWIVYHQSMLNWDFQPDCTLVTLDERGQTVSLWNAAVYQKKSSLPLSSKLERVIRQGSSSDGQVVAMQSFDTLQMWDGSTGRLLQTVSRKGMGGLAFSPDNQWLAWVSDNSVVNLWDVASRGREVHLQLKAEARFVSSLSFAPDGQTLIVVYDTNNGPHGMQRFIELWDVAMGQELAVFHSDSRSFYVSIASHGPALVAHSVRSEPGQDLAAIPVVDLISGRPLQIPDKSYPVTIVDNRLSAVLVDSQIELWDITTGRQVHKPSQYVSDWTEVILSPDGRLLAVSDQDNSEHNMVQVWDVATGQQQISLTTGLIWGLAFAPNSKILATAKRNSEIVFWDVTTGSTTRTLNTSGASVSALAFSPDGRVLALADPAAKSIHLWDIAAGQELLTLTGHLDKINAVAFSPDGRTLASASDDHTLKLWEVATGHELITLQGHNGAVDKVVFSADGKHLVSSSYDGTVRVWGVP